MIVHARADEPPNNGLQAMCRKRRALEARRLISHESTNTICIYFIFDGQSCLAGGASDWAAG